MLALVDRHVGTLGDRREHARVLPRKPSLLPPQRRVYRRIHVDHTVRQRRNVVRFAGLRDAPVERKGDFSIICQNKLPRFAGNNAGVYTVQKFQIPNPNTHCSEIHLSATRKGQKVNIGSRRWINATTTTDQILVQEGCAALTHTLLIRH